MEQDPVRKDRVLLLDFEAFSFAINSCRGAADKPRLHIGPIEQLVSTVSVNHEVVEKRQEGGQC